MTSKELNRDSRIAAYLRKSREDEEAQDGDTLRKHRERLEEFVQKEGFTNVEWFEEVASGGSIDKRPVFTNLLERIRLMHFDAVLVVAQDRLSRGDTYEQGIIERAFKETGTIVLLPTGETIDYNDKNQGFVAGIKASFANYELEVIKERMIEGKKKTVKDGRPHNGIAPYGYYWNRNTKTMEIDHEEAKVYRMMVDMFLKEDMSASAIANRFEEMKIPSPKGKSRWFAETITRLLRNDFHKGNVVYGRYSRSTDGRVRQKENERKAILRRGKHQPLKSECEHVQILKRIEQLRTNKNRNYTVRKNMYRLSGLVYCPYCGKCQMVMRVNSKGRPIHLKKCHKKSSTRTIECDTKTKGIKEDILVEAILSQMRKYKQDLFAPNENIDKETQSSVQELINYQEQSAEKSRKRIEKAKVMFMDEIIDRQELKSIVEKEEANIQDCEMKISELRASSGLIDEAELEERKRRWSEDDVQYLLEGGEMTDSEMNDIFRKLIDRVSYIRDEEDNVTVRIKYK
jgi:site-specific DNA recombinase